MADSTRPLNWVEVTDDLSTENLRAAVEKLEDFGYRVHSIIQRGEWTSAQYVVIGERVMGHGAQEVQWVARMNREGNNERL